MFGVSAAVGGGFAGLLSIFNMGGRFVWSSVSDYTGRKTVYCIYFLLGALCIARAVTQNIQNKRSLSPSRPSSSLCMAAASPPSRRIYATCSVTYQIGPFTDASHHCGSVAALLGLSLVNYISTARIEAGVPKAEAYNSTMFLMAGLLMIGLIANLLVRAVDPKYHVTEPPSLNL
jgi:hypothetical protein